MKDVFKSSIRITGIHRLKRKALQATISAPPGIEHLPEINTPPPKESIHIECIDFGADKIQPFKTNDVAELIAHSRPDWGHNRWINIKGLHPFVISQLAEHFNLHPLAAEDVLNPHQRSKIESYDGALFIVMRMLRFVDDRLINEQVSFWFDENTLITIQEKSGDVWGGVRKRLEISSSRFRKFGVSYLLYALIDAIVDHCFPLLEAYGTTIDTLEAEILCKQSPAMQQRIHAIKRELIFLRQVMWPIRDVISALYRDENELLPDEVETYFRDVYDHAIQVIDSIEVYREMAGGLHELYNSAVSNRMNEIMKVLTIIASIFVPITFLAGVYGMNFKNLPELQWPWAYPLFWFICATLTVSLLYLFYRKGWLGNFD